MRMPGSPAFIEVEAARSRSAAGGRGRRVDWSEIHTRLAADDGDALAWQALEASVRVWARSALRRCEEAVIDDAVADTCAGVFINLSRARGPETFRGFALGYWLNTRRRVLEARAAAAFGLDPLDVAA